MNETRESYPLVATQSIDYSLMAEYRRFVCSGTITITIPSPDVDFTELGDIDFVQEANANLTISCSNGFPYALDSITVAAGQACRIACCADVAGGYTWYAIGGTAA